MSLTTQHIEEALCRAYVEAVAGRAGVTISFPLHDYGEDISFKSIKVSNGRHRTSRTQLLAQLKASKNCIFTKEAVGYDLEAKAYNDLVYKTEDGLGSPFILIVLCLPKNPAEWLEVSEEQLLLRKCCYWHHLVGEPTNNVGTKRIFIPRSQLFTPDALKDLLEQAKKGAIR